MKTGATMQIPKQVLVTDVVARDGFQNCRATLKMLREAESLIEEIAAKENQPCLSIPRLRRY